MNSIRNMTYYTHRASSALQWHASDKDPQEKQDAEEAQAQRLRETSTNYTRHIHTHTHTHTHTERERERHTHTHTHTPLINKLVRHQTSLIQVYGALPAPRASLLRSVSSDAEALAPR